MLIKKRYEETAQLFGKIRGGLYPDDIFELLDDLGYDSKEVVYLPKSGVALVAIQWKDENLPGHFIVWDSKRYQFLDPSHGVINKNDMLKHAMIDFIWKITRRYK